MKTKKLILRFYTLLSFLAVALVWYLGFETILYFFSLVPVNEWAGLIKLGVGIVTIPSAFGICIILSTVAYNFVKLIRPSFMDDWEKQISDDNWKKMMERFTK